MQSEFGFTLLGKYAFIFCTSKQWHPCLKKSSCHMLRLSLKSLQVSPKFGNCAGNKLRRGRALIWIPYNTDATGMPRMERQSGALICHLEFSLKCWQRIAPCQSELKHSRHRLTIFACCCCRVETKIIMQVECFVSLARISVRVRVSCLRVRLKLSANPRKCWNAPKWGNQLYDHSLF